jgi:hypothetical protein
MTKASKTNEDLLRSVGGYAQGTKVNIIGAHMRQLFDAGLIGPSGGLTRKGSILAERVQNAHLDELFG